MKVILSGGFEGFPVSLAAAYLDTLGMDYYMYEGDEYGRFRKKNPDIVGYSDDSGYTRNYYYILTLKDYGDAVWYRDIFKSDIFEPVLKDYRTNQLLAEIIDDFPNGFFNVHCVDVSPVEEYFIQTIYDSVGECYEVVVRKEDVEWLNPKEA